MRIHYRNTEGGIEVVRCFGTDGRVEIPEQIGGKPVAAVAAYAFSARKDREDEDVQIWESGDSRLFRAQESLLAGEDVVSVHFPDSVRKIGRYIFYGCRRLESIAFSDALADVGTGAFTGCRALRKLEVRLRNGKQTCVSGILGDLWQRIDVTFYACGEARHGERGAGRSVRPGGRTGTDREIRLVFPEHYEEAVENTPARILFTQHHGSGNNYRQCFYNREMDYRKYDELFYSAKAQDRISVIADLVFSRLMFPEDLTAAAEKSYEDYVRENGEKIAGYLTDTENMEALREMSRRGLWTKEALDAALEYAASGRISGAAPGRTSGSALGGGGRVLSFLMEEKHRLFPAGRSDGRKRYEL